MCGPKYPHSNEFQMRIKRLLVYRYFIFKLNKAEMCFNEIHVCAYGKVEERKIYLKLKPGISKAANYDFPHPCDDPRNIRLFQ
jgi:hypothetical protein